jgi:hypothetical protein
MNNTSGGGISLLTVLGIVFIVLKLTKTIDWSWWWVLAPFWIPFVFVMAFMLIFFLLGGLIALLQKK